MLAFRFIIDQFISRSSKALRIFILTYVAYATLYATRKPFSVVKTHVQEDLKLSTHTLGLIDSAFLGAYAVGQLVLPALLLKLHRFTPNQIILFLYVGSGCAAIAFGLSSSGVALILLWLLNGLLHSAVFPILVGCTSPWFAAERRGQIMGTWTTSQQVGATCATLFSAYVAHISHWRLVFLLPGIFTIAFGIFLSFTLTPSHNADEERTKTIHTRLDIELGSTTTTASSVQTSPGKNALPPVAIPAPVSVRALLRIPDIKAVGLAYCFVKCVRYSLLFWLPYYLTTELHYDADIAGYASIVFDIGGIFGGIMSGQLADRFLKGRRILMALFTGLTSALALIFFAIGAHQSTLVALSLMTLVGFAVAGSDSIIGGSAPSDLCDRAQIDNAVLPAASGIVNGLGSTGAVIQGSLTAYVSDAYGWGHLYALLASTALASSLCLMRPAIHESAALRNRQ
eukprot:Blabericola_migrator_1__4251@NODE_22_length_22262_cov_139_742014_g19_i0_p6_GENE_NODE_22_length_22262_cov_139_742014_g19_i0NODE_22_length_22262_cov_139_742014_g19_i0_p6_ORF_typecomplete_len456_score47_59MFS_1/PF07690_16/8e44MFS_1/PF07690_16/0_04MFS_3/PF05977_13/1_2e09MFS_3/PF05977_13/3_1e05MFS_4/PF06779_14/8_8e14MFS_4/PF06779_14/1_5Sugar_tr/PF00083_24/3_3e12MFS_1_like/PF12832_7/0_13MFS_1_like/PF12832_7/9e07OATP/PF03137_20/3_5e05PUCC/PF03209_15/0_00098PUCC/PF03209_15/5_4e02Nuc_H_symport/PF03825_16